MLIDFTVKNFLSFRDKVTLSAETGERLSKYKQTNTITENQLSLLKNVLIFGPNGSGKTNLILAMRTLRDLVVNQRTNVTDTLPGQPFSLSAGWQEKPAEFTIRFSTGAHEFRYQISYFDRSVEHEQLSILKGGEDEVYFDRHQQSFGTVPDGASHLARATRPNGLFLYSLQEANDELAVAIMHWFRNDLVFVNDQVIPDNLVGLLSDDQVKQEFLQFIRFADFNVEDVSVKQVAAPELPEALRTLILQSRPEARIPQTTNQIFVAHKVYDAQGHVTGREEFQLASESRGTQKVFILALAMIGAQLSGNGKTLVIDEFDDALHFELSLALVKLFNSRANLNQVILTTHQLGLLDAGLRVDQIYLMDKTFQGASTLNSVFDFRDSRGRARRDISYLKRYLQGRFGAVPQIDFEQMQTTILNNNHDWENDYGEKVKGDS